MFVSSSSETRRKKYGFRNRMYVQASTDTLSKDFFYLMDKILERNKTGSCFFHSRVIFRFIF